LNATGFNFSTQSPESHKAAMVLVRGKGELMDSGSYQRVFPSDSELWVMEDTEATQEYLRNFFGN